MRTASYSTKQFVEEEEQVEDEAMDQFKGKKEKECGKNKQF